MTGCEAVSVWCVFDPQHKLLAVFADPESARVFARDEVDDRTGVGGFITTERWEVRTKGDEHGTLQGA